MTIVNMTAAHVAQIGEMEKLCFSAPWSVDSIAHELENPLSRWLVALEGAQVVGYIGSQSVLGESDMMNVAVHPDHRRKGIGETLILALMAALKEEGNDTLTLEVRASNEPAKALYRKLGFQQVGCRKNYYRHPKEDGLILKKAL